MTRAMGNNPSPLMRLIFLTLSDLFAQWNSSPTPSLPDANSTALGSIRTDYNFVSWTGNTSAYLQVGDQQTNTCIHFNPLKSS